MKHLIYFSVLLVSLTRTVSAQDLCNSTLTNDTAGVVEALSKGADPDTFCIFDGYNMTALTWATFDGYEDIVVALLAKNASVDLISPVSSGSYTTALVEAATYGRVPIARLLIDAGADVDLPGYYDYTPLIWATDYEFLEMTQLLVDSRADVNLYDFDGVTAMMWGIEGMDPSQDVTDIAKYLLDHGSERDAMDDANLTALYYAIDSNLTDVIELLENFVCAQNTTNTWRDYYANTSLPVELKPFFYPELSSWDDKETALDATGGFPCDSNRVLYLNDVEVTSASLTCLNALFTLHVNEKVFSEESDTWTCEASTEPPRRCEDPDATVRSLFGSGAISMMAKSTRSEGACPLYSFTCGCSLTPMLYRKTRAGRFTRLSPVACSDVTLACNACDHNGGEDEEEEEEWVVSVSTGVGRTTVALADFMDSYRLSCVECNGCNCGYGYN